MIYNDIYVDSYGAKLRELRLKNGMTINKLSIELSISSTTLMHVEQNKIKVPYYYWKVICNYFNMNNINYLKLYDMKQNTTKEKLVKIRACIGAENWGYVGKHLGCSRGYINDILTRYKPNRDILSRIDLSLEKINGVPL